MESAMATLDDLGHCDEVDGDEQLLGIYLQLRHRIRRLSCLTIILACMRVMQEKEEKR